jgi:hypothetical protein
VSGLLADDHGHYWHTDPPEIHPVYAFDLVQDWNRLRPNATLTGAWHCDDLGTYHLRQSAGSRVFAARS